MIRQILERDFVECYLDDSIPVLRHRWTRKPTTLEFQGGLTDILEEYKKLKEKFPDLKWLADTELLDELAEEAEEWLTDEWDRMLFGEAGVTVHAVILGDDLFADYPMEKFKISSDQKFAEQGVKLGVFPDEESAYEWLKGN